MSNSGVGVDWAGGDWVFVKYGSGAVEADVEPDIDSICSRFTQQDLKIAFDVPIGLPSEEGSQFRDCDSRAREVIGYPRASSVFNAPAREAVIEQQEEEASYQSVSEKNKNVTNKGLSMQSYHIIDAIGQMDEYLNSEDGPPLSQEDGTFGRWFESHPEVCFRAFAGNELEHSKTSAAGFAERLDALEGQPADIERPEELVRDVCDDLAVHDNVEINDVLDALVLAITAAGEEEELHRLPEENPPLDENNLPKEIVYLSEGPVIRTFN